MGREGLLLLVLCGAMFLEGVDVAMLNVAVPDIRADLGLGDAQAQWVVSAYVLGYGGFLLLGGRAADLLGRRRVFLVALLVFVGFSAVGGLAFASWELVGARFATGVAAGFLMPAGLSIVTTTFTGALRDRAVVVYGAVGAAGFALGMVAGGLLTALGWRWVFFGPVVVGTVLLAVGRAVIPADPPQEAAATLDVRGAVLVTAATVTGVLGLVTLGEGARGRAGVLLLAAGALLLRFVRHVRRHPAPLVRLALLREGRLAASSAVGLLMMGAYFGFQLLATLYLQDLRGWSPVQAGLAFAVMGLDLVLAPALTPALVRRLGRPAVIALGCAAGLAAYALFLAVRADWGFGAMLPSLLLVGVSFALVYGPLTLEATEGVREDEQGLAGGVLNTAFQLGAALGLALVAAVALAPAATLDLDRVRAGVWVPTALMAAAVAVASTSLGRLRRRTPPRPVPAPARVGGVAARRP